MVEFKTYISNLRFDPRLKNTWVAKYLTNIRLLLLIILTIVVAGSNSFAQIPRVLNPEINIPIVIVSTALPGANPTDVESLVTIPLEDAVRGVDDVKTVTSTSNDSFSNVSIEFESGVDSEKARSDVQSAVDTVNDLPTDAQTPRVSKIDFQDTPVWQFVISSKADLASLTQFADDLQEKMDDLSSIDRANVSGIEQDEFQVQIKPDAISTYKVNPLQLSSAVKAAVGSFPAGTVKTSNSNFALTIDPSATSVEELRETRVLLGDTVVPLSQIATIYQRSKPDQLPSYYASPTTPLQRGITFTVYKASGATIYTAEKDAKKLVEDQLALYPNQFEVKTLLNASEEVSTQFNELVRDLTITVILIFILLFIFLGLRQAIVASIAVPLTFLMTFVVMQLTGIDFSFIAFFSMLLALGLLVDDTIVVISAMTAYFRTGKFTPLETALLVWRDFVVAIFTTTITTVWAFLPLLLSTGIIGEFIKPIPIVVSTTLLSSFIVAMFITMPFIIFLLSPSIPRRVRIFLQLLLLGALFGLFILLVPKTILPLQILAFIILGLVVFRVRKTLVDEIKTRVKPLRRNFEKSLVGKNIDSGIIHFTIFESRYHRILDRILSSSSGRRKTLIAVIVFSLFAYLLLPLGLVVNEFFPKSEQNYIYASLELPSGTNAEKTKREVMVITEGLRTLPSVEYISVDVGQGVQTGFGGSSSGQNIASFTIHLVEKGKRKINSLELANLMRKQFATYQAGELSVVEESGGPPAGADLQIKLFGDDLKTLDGYANKIVEYLKTQNGVVDPSKSIKPGTGKLVFVPDKEKLSQNSLSEDQLGPWLRTYASGFTLDKVKFGEKEEKDITLRFSPDVVTPEGITGVVIPTQQGDLPLANLGHLMLQTNPTLITREDGKRTISVSATVSQGFSVTTLNSQLEKYADTLNLPSGYSWQTGGVNEENQNSVNSILQAMLLSFLLIIVTMVLQFGSFRKAIIVMLVIPLSIAGVFIVFALTRTPLSFPALIGVLALFGIVVKNSILVVDKISQNEKAGLEFKTAISDGATSRLEPIALTSIVAIIGLIPVTISDPIWRGLGGAIIAGLTFSGTIMLFFIPVVYYYWFHPKEEKIPRRR